MNVIAQGCLVEALDSLDAAMQALENHADNGPPALVGDAYRHLLQVRGQLAALRQFAELAAALEHGSAADRAPSLRVVR